MKTSLKSKSRCCPYRNLCNEYGECNTCDHGIAYFKLSTKIKRLNEKLGKARYIVVEVNDTTRDVAVFGPFDTTKEAKQRMLDRYYDLSETTPPAGVDESNCLMDSYSVLHPNGNGSIIFGCIKTIPGANP